MKKILPALSVANVVALILCAAVFLVAPVHSQAPNLTDFQTQTPLVGEHIQTFSDKITINRDGTMDVVETIVYDFGYLTRHGIFRDIPYVLNRNGKRYRQQIENISVTDENGLSYRFKRSTVGDYINLKIGDPDRTITGVHTYVISYKFSGALRYFSAHDELNWNINGTGWDVPVGRVNAEVSLPKPADTNHMQAACFTGAYGLKGADCKPNFDDHSASFETTRSLDAGENMTIVFGFPKGLVAVLNPTEIIPFWKTPFGILLAGIIGLGALFWYVIYPIKIIIKWYLYGRDPKVDGPTTDWYEAPKTPGGRALTPGETGALLDERVDMRDIEAVIVGLAQRGFIKIEERAKKDFYLIQKSAPRGGKLTGFEKKFMTDLFGSSDEVRLKDAKLYNTVPEVKSMIYQQLVTDGFFPKNPSTTRVFYGFIAVMALASLNLFLFVVALIFGLNMPRKTVAGAQAAAVAKSLKNFLSSQERQLEFQAKQQYWFEKLLPFAVAFGVEKIWAERFKDINLKEPSWYNGYYPGSRFTTAGFSQSLGRAFTSSITSSSVPPSSSGSGFSSGGGFSGGGGGGGGGGSW